MKITVAIALFCFAARVASASTPSSCQIIQINSPFEYLFPINTPAETCFNLAGSERLAEVSVAAIAYNDQKYSITVTESKAGHRRLIGTYIADVDGLAVFVVQPAGRTLSFRLAPKGSNGKVFKISGLYTVMDAAASLVLMLDDAQPPR